MLRYDHLEDCPRDFLATISLTLAEFTGCCAFETTCDDFSPSPLTAVGKARQRQW